MNEVSTILSEMKKLKNFKGRKDIAERRDFAVAKKIQNLSDVNKMRLANALKADDELGSVVFGHFYPVRRMVIKVHRILNGHANDLISKNGEELSPEAIKKFRKVTLALRLLYRRLKDCDSLRDE
jgi:hypothetical protein